MNAISTRMAGKLADAANTRYYFDPHTALSNGAREVCPFFANQVQKRCNCAIRSTLGHCLYSSPSVSRCTDDFTSFAETFRC